MLTVASPYSGILSITTGSGLTVTVATQLLAGTYTISSTLANSLKLQGDLEEQRSGNIGNYWIEFNGGNAQTVENTAGLTVSLSNVRINKSGGTLTFANDLIVQRSFTYTGTGGDVDLSDVTVRFETGAGAVINSGLLHFGDVVVDKAAASVNFQGGSIVDGNFTVEDTYTGVLSGTVELAGDDQVLTCRARRTARARP